MPYLVYSGLGHPGSPSLLDALMAVETGRVRNPGSCEFQ